MSTIDYAIGSIWGFYFAVAFTSVIIMVGISSSKGESCVKTGVLWVLIYGFVYFVLSFLVESYMQSKFTWIEQRRGTQQTAFEEVVGQGLSLVEDDQRDTLSDAYWCREMPERMGNWLGYVYRSLPVDKSAIPYDLMILTPDNYGYVVRSKGSFELKADAPVFHDLIRGIGAGDVVVFDAIPVSEDCSAIWVGNFPFVTIDIQSLQKAGY